MQTNLDFSKYPFLIELGLLPTTQGLNNGLDNKANGKTISTTNPHNNRPIGNIVLANEDDYERCVKAAVDAGKDWRAMPMPKRGDIIREIGNELRKHLTALGSLIALENGKILAEGIGEVQEFIDMCDYACGLSRSIGGKVIPSERPDHLIIERWNPLGVVGVISAFNFPNAVFGWNLALSLVCGNCLIWKGSESVGLVTMATASIIRGVLDRFNIAKGVFSAMVAYGPGVGDLFLDDKRIDLVSFTGSTRVGRMASERVAKRFGKTILELGGNNAVIVCEDADLDLTIKGCFFAAVGTCGQRCTTLRRLYIHESVYDKVKNSLVSAYKGVRIGDPLDSKTLCGPLHSKMGMQIYKDGLERIQKQGGKVITGGKVHDKLPEGNYVEPTIVEIDPKADIVNEELFVPILYIFKFKTLDEAIEYNNGVPQGLSASIFTKNMQNVFKWIGPNGSYTGLINVNVGPSGAEIGGAFGGEKETGGGRESGSDAWKQYMRRGTCTVNFGNKMPLAQGIDFGPSL